MHPALQPAIAQAFPDSAADDQKRPSSRSSRRGRLPATRRRPVWLAIAVATSLLAACGGGHNDNNNGSLTIEQLSNLSGAVKDLTIEFHEGTNMAATPSPDGQRIAFTAQGAIWVVPFAGGPATRITPWTIEPTQPVWSPDGKVIAFQNYTLDGNWHIWTVQPDGRDAKEITTGFFDDREPAWMPDGSGLVFASDRSGDGQYKIWSYTLATGAYKQLTTGPGAESNPVVSPDGKQIAFVDTARVFVAQMSGGAPVQAAAGGAPAWAPSGSGLIYQSTTTSLNSGGNNVVVNGICFRFRSSCCRTTDSSTRPTARSGSAISTART